MPIFSLMSSGRPVAVFDLFGGVVRIFWSQARNYLNRSTSSVLWNSGSALRIRIDPKPRMMTINRTILQLKEIHILRDLTSFLHPLGKHPKTDIYRPGFEPRPPAQQAGTNGFGIVSWQLTHLSVLIPTIFCY